jgi:diguanylate cyclase (GGDEF)-like protein
MGPEASNLGEWIPSATALVTLFVVAAASFVLGSRGATKRAQERVRALEQALAQSERRGADAQRANEELWERMERAETAVRALQRSIVQIPEIAQRLFALRELREIPDGTLDLVQEIFQPSYSVFYRVSNSRLVAVACRGDSEFRIGHRLEPGEGVVGWTAVKQMPFSPEDAEFESASVRSQKLARCLPRRGFSLCVPIMGQERPLGVILIGPSARHLPHAREIGRTIALLSSVAIESTVVLSKERVLAKTDGLTGLLNKTNIYRRLRDLMSEDGMLVSVFLLDIDHFKHYNDTNGHLPGDELLKRMGLLLRENSRENEVVGRYGGEEFLVLMPGTPKQTALRVAERIRALVAETPFEHAERQPGGRVTISGGVASWPGDGDDVDSLLRAADGALYEAKRGGRNRVLSHSGPALPTAEVSTLDLREGETAAREKPEVPELD